MFERRGPELNKGKIGQLLIDLGSDENNGVRWRAFLRKSGVLLGNSICARSTVE
jgi:hypothetical protein